MYRLLLAGAALAAAALPANAAPIVSADPVPASVIEARARNGNTGFEAVLFTPADPSPGTAATQLNPVGAPIWSSVGSYANFWRFQFTYTASTGTATWAIDFSRDNDFLDTEETATSTSPTLAGQSFQYVNLFSQGTGTVFALTDNVILNGVAVPDAATTAGTQFVNQLYEDTSGLFADITITGELRFTGSGGGERPRFWVQLGAPAPLPPPVPVPAPAALGLFGIGLLGLALARRRQAG